MMWRRLVSSVTHPLGSTGFRSIVGVVLLLTIPAISAWSAETIHFTSLESGQEPSSPEHDGVSHGPTAAEHADAGPVLQIHFLDVGQGDSTLIVCPDGSQILIDCGTLPISKARARSAQEYISGIVDDGLETLILTHPDTDHYDLIPYALRSIGIDEILIVDSNEDYPKTTMRPDLTTEKGYMNSWLHAIDQDNRVTRLDSDDFDADDAPNGFCECGDADIFVVAADVPSESNQSNRVVNSLSISILVSFGEFQALLMGDATDDTEAEIMGRYPAESLDVELLKLGHHGSLSTSSSWDWIQTTKPEVAVASAGFSNQHGHPNETVKQRVDNFTVAAPFHELRRWVRRFELSPSQNTGQAIYSTASSGNIVLVTNGDWYDVTVER